jgi:molybdenum cofactor cytidylyltransferase
MNKADFDSSTAGIVLAAGRSERMGRPKMDLPWGDTTVLGKVIRSLSAGGLKKIYVVINPVRKPVLSESFPHIDLAWIENPAAETNEMLKSIQTGLSNLSDEIDFAFISLGDQPTIRPDVINKVLVTRKESQETLIFPSYRFRRGHPWGVGREYWGEICNLKSTDTVRTFIQAHADVIHYVNFDFESPEDIDTPEMYEDLKKTSNL